MQKRRLHSRDKYVSFNYTHKYLKELQIERLNGEMPFPLDNDDMTCEFSNLGIQCVKKKDIEESLRVREEIRVDPFRSKYSVLLQYIKYALGLGMGIILCLDIM